MLDKPRHPFSAPSARPGLLLAILFLVSLSHPATASPGFQISGETARLVGRVFGEHGQNLANARVRLETNEGDLIAEVATDDQGRYNLSGLNRAIYHLTVTCDGFDTVRQTVDLTRSAFHTIVDIPMTPLNKAPVAGDPPSLTDVSAPKKARQEYQKGMRALAANRIPEAKVHFSNAVETYPCYARAQTAVALGFVSDHDLARAETALKKSIECDPGYSSAYLKLGELYNIQSRFRESAPMLQEGLRREPGFWQFHYQLGVAYYGSGAYEKAEAEYLSSEGFNPPAPPEVHVKLADVYFKQRSFHKAYTEMQAYLSADPNGSFAPKVKDLIRQMEAYRTVRGETPGSAPTPSAQP